MKINVIVAVSDNGVIGKDGKIPWKLSTDLKRFKEITTGYPCIMGRKTWESLRSPLEERKNIVVSKGMMVTRNSPKHAVYLLRGGYKILYTSSLDVALDIFRDHPTPHAVFIIGGQQIYDEIFKTPELIHRVYITRVHCEVEGDTFFKHPFTLDKQELDKWHKNTKGWSDLPLDWHEIEGKSIVWNGWGICNRFELVSEEFIPKGDKDEYDSTFQVWENSK